MGHLKGGGRSFLISVIFNEFVFILAASIAFLFGLLHPTFAAGFSLVLSKSPIGHLAHAIVYMNSSTYRCTDVYNG